jgi:hypothetical protein
MKTVQERFWEKVDMTGRCWEWTGVLHEKGYGIFYLEGRSRLAHRISFEFKSGKIEHGLTLDHLCRNRKCVNPDHLEPVTNKENVLRGEGRTAVNAKKAHCIKGHLFDLANTRITSSRRRCCITCKKELDRLYKIRLKNEFGYAADRRKPKTMKLKAVGEG